MKRPLLPLALLLMASGALGKDRSTFRYAPLAGEERPVVTDASVGPQSSDFALRLRFQKSPYGQECGTRCANATLLLDTDSNAQSGLQLQDKAAENGADLAIIIQGTRDLAGTSTESFLRVKVRRLTNEARTVDDGEVIAELDHRHDVERVHVEGNTLFLLIDSNALPSGRSVRVIYHPPGSKAIQAVVPGILNAGKSNVMLFRHGNWGKVPQAGQRVNPPAADKK